MVCESSLFIINNLVQRMHRETLACRSKIVEGLSLSGNVALASTRICVTQEVEGGNLEHKDNVEAERVATLGE